MDYRDLTSKDMEMQEKMLLRYDDLLRNLPKGSLVCRTKNDAKEFYHLDNITGNRKYIKKDNQTLLAALTQRKVMEESCKRMNSNLSLQRRLIKDYKNYDYESVLRDLSPSYSSWQMSGKTDETANSKLRPQGLIHLTSGGQKVRSKTEVMIVETLYTYEMPVLYERPLKLLDENGKTFICHPDFSFEDRYGRWIFWEHFGMLGDENYRRDALWKIERYIDNGIMPSVNLIITSESSDGALDMRTIVSTVEYIKKLL